MIFHETDVGGVFVVALDRHEDERGFFARVWDPEELAGAGLDAGLAQSSISWNARRGTLRGMHYQRPPGEEAKLVRCIRGSVLDVVLDLRHDSATYRRWISVELSAENRMALYVPKGCAHGFITLADDTELLYMIAQVHDAELAAGVRWDDPAFGIQWPLHPLVISQRDATYPDYTGS